MNSDGLPRVKRFRIAVRRFAAFEEAIRLQWESFESRAKTGLTLELIPFELSRLEHALFGSGGMASSEWDVAFVATDWIASMHVLRCAVDLTDRLQTDPPPDYPAGWHPSLLRLQRVQDAVLGVPYHDGPECLIYRRDLFDDGRLRERFQARFGRELSVPRNWAEFHETAKFFQDPSRRLFGTAFAAYPDGHNPVYDFLLQLWTRGGELIDSTGAVRFGTAEAEAALDFYRTMLVEGNAVHPDCRRLDSVATGQRFAEGEIAMMINWFGFATLAHTSPESAVRGHVDVAEIPRDEGARSVSLNVYWILSIAAGSPHRDAAWRFLKHTLRPEMDRVTAICGAIGCRRSTWNDAAINADIPFYRSMERLHDNAREIPQRADWPRIAGIIDTLVTSALNSELPSRRLLQTADADFSGSGR